MALYVIGDTHFSEGTDKPMDIFGGAWVGSRQKLLDGFSATLTPEDTLVLCGDFSWGMTLEQTLPDFKLLDAFPGRKLLLKGNHDYWWETVSKMRRFFLQHEITTIDFLHNNSFVYQETSLCGTRGWFYDKDDPEANSDKIYQREVMRLEASLKAAETEEIYAFLHYPPVFNGAQAEEICALMRKYAVSRCFYGHLHGYALKGAFSGMLDGTYYTSVSADGLGFRPIQVKN